MIAPATMKTTAAAGWAAVHTGPENGKGATGFHITAMATNTGIHHQCRACMANQATISAKIDATNWTRGAQLARISAGARNKMAAAMRLGARAFR